MKGVNWKTTLISIGIGAFFLYFAFRNTSLGEMFQHIENVPGFLVLSIAFGVVLGTVLRGLRWWFTLPEPRFFSEMGPIQRALGICYGANNFIPRSGEIVRILVTKRETGRSLASLSSTVILDRFFLDLLGLIGMMIIAFLINARILLNIYAHAYQALYFLLFISFLSLSGLLLLAFKPGFFISLLGVLQLKRVPAVFTRIEALTSDLSLGMSSIKRLGSFVSILGQTVLMWAAYLAVFYVGLIAFEIKCTIPQATLAFSLSMLGVVFPSPGAIGTYHFFTKTALVHVFSLGEAQALSFAFFMHAVMYITNTIYGMICLAFSLGKTKKKAPHVQGLKLI